MTRNGFLRSLFQRAGTGSAPRPRDGSRQVHTSGAPPPAEPTTEAELVAEGDRHRDAGEYALAGEAYRAALEMAPGRTEIRVQYGNMLKDTGRLAEAEAAYCAALAENPDDADIHLQLGHALKLGGRRSEATQAYLQAAALMPEAPAPIQELRLLGHHAAQEEFFRAQLRVIGIEGLRDLARRAAELRELFEGPPALLIDLAAQLAVPIGCYDAYRAIYEMPPAPQLPGAPGFAVILVADAAAAEQLEAQVAALRSQTYRRWQLLVLGSDPAKQRVIDDAAAEEPRIRWIAAQAGESAAAAEWRAGLSTSAEWLLLLAEGAVLHPQALEWFAAAAAGTRADAFVTDEEIEIAAGTAAARFRPELRQVVDYDTLLEANVFGGTIAVGREAFLGFPALTQAGSVATARSLLLLELARKGRVGHVPCILVRRNGGGEAVQREAHQEAVLAHLAACGEARLSMGPARWMPRRPAAPIAAIMPTRDNGGDVDQAIESLVAKAAESDALRLVIVDNGSVDPATLSTLDRLAATRRAKVLRIDEPFNWSRLNNRAAAEADAPVLLFVNDDVRMLTAGWDERLRGLIERPEIGALGARLLYPDDTLQHGGMLFGWPESLTIHDGLYASDAEPGPACRWQVTRAVSAVTGAFLATRRDVFEAHGGFDDTELAVSYGDVDYALKLRRSGLKILWTPQITLYHFESKTRGLDHLDPEKRARDAAERAVMRERWGAVLDSDPSLNPAWLMASLPFRLLAPPSADRFWAHIERCAEENPWAIDP